MKDCGSGEVSKIMAIAFRGSPCRGGQRHTVEEKGSDDLTELQRHGKGCIEENHTPEGDETESRVEEQLLSCRGVVSQLPAYC